MPVSLSGRFEHERERLGPEFTDAERKWRIKWYKSQELHESEPVRVPDLYVELRNPLRRFYQIPLNYVQFKLLKPVIVSLIVVLFLVTSCLVTPFVP